MKGFVEVALLFTFPVNKPFKVLVSVLHSHKANRQIVQKQNEQEEKKMVSIYMPPSSCIIPVIASDRELLLLLTLPVKS